MAPIGGGISSKAIAAVIVPLNWSAQLAFVVFILAAMQGTLGLESADPCRISIEKFRLLLLLQALEVVSAIVCEIISFISLSTSLSLRFQWLQWVAPALLAFGILQLILQTWFVLAHAARSRVYWQPLSACGRRTDGTKWTIIVQTAMPVLLTILSIYLFGWVQQWWLKSSLVSETVSIKRSEDWGAMSTGALTVCFAWGIFIIAVVSSGLIFLEFYKTFCKSSRETDEPMFKMLARSFDCGKLCARNGRWVNTPHTEKDERVFEALYQLEYGNLYTRQDYLESDYLNTMKDDAKKSSMSSSPPHLRNAIVGVFREQLYRRFGNSSTCDRFRVIFALHVTILPLLLCVAIGVTQMHDALDILSREALVEFVDAVVIVAVINIAFTVKVLLWGFGHTESLHNYDRDYGAETNSSSERTVGIFGSFFQIFKQIRRRLTSSNASSASSSSLSSANNNAQAEAQDLITGMSTVTNRPQPEALATTL